MDLDALSGVVAYKHTGESVMTVTAAVDRITLKNPLKEICDLQLSGQVTFATGRSSMEISLQFAKAPRAGSHVKDDDVLLICAFTMVSLDPSTKKPVAVAPLKLESPEDHRLFQLGEKNYDAKKAFAKRNLRKSAPNDEESEIIHSMWMSQREFSGKSPLMLVQNPSLTLDRPQNSPDQTPKRRLHVSYEAPVCPDNATPVPQPTQFHDLRRLPPQADLRASLLLRGRILALTPSLRQPRSQHF